MINSEKKAIVEFFLNIFKLQMGLGGRAGQYRMIADAGSDGDRIFELRVQERAQWVSRRMAIAPLGEAGGSKSRCYKVTYDDMIVVKIPPVPITDFSKYFDSIQAERRVAQQLDPEIRCITPSLSAILRKIPPFSNELDTDFKTFEARCYQKISILPIFQKYLKIGNTFAFFMNLSQYSFLGQIIREMHSVDARMEREILTQTEIIGHPLLFEEIYGTDTDGIFFEIDGLYGEYEDALERLLKRYNISSTAAYSRKEWFLSHLAGSRATPDGEHFPPAFTVALNRMIEKILSTEPAVIAAFEKTMRSYISRKLFVQNKALMAGVITNLLQQLAVLYQKQVAMRDLKPENVFVAGDLSEDPLLLERVERYSIGLIDFETAVILNPGDGTAIAQPKLGGTPSYATVSHLFTNDILALTYPSLPRILHLQDWYAINGMIFNVVTGQRLNGETGRLMPKMIRDIRLSVQKNIPRTETYHQYSCLFWGTALREFKQRLGFSAKRLRDVRVRIPKLAESMLTAEVEAAKRTLEQRISGLLKNSTLPMSPKDIEALVTASHATLVQWRKRWEKEAAVPKLSETSRHHFLGLLSEVAKLRWEWEGMDAFIARLSIPKPVVSADVLLVVMFNTVRIAMHMSAWGEISDDRLPTPVTSPASPVDNGATRAFEETVEIE